MMNEALCSFRTRFGFLSETQFPARLPIMMAVGTILLVLLSFPVPLDAQEPFSEEIGLGEEALDDGDNARALRHFRKAEKLSHGEVPETYLGIGRASFRLGAFADSIEALKTLRSLEIDGEMRAISGHLLGVALIAQAKAKDHSEPLLEEAIGVLRSVIAETPEAQGPPPPSVFFLGLALLRVGQESAGIEQLERYLEIDPNGSMTARARSYLDNPLRATTAILPVFTLVTLDGRVLTDEDFAGKVVLFDFWATWCAPCVAAIPSLKRTAKRMERGDPFELISVSTDNDRSVLQRFLTENAMDWTQAWDERGEVSRASFGVSGFPTYVLVSHEGKILFTASGWGTAIEAELSSQIRKAIRAAKKAQKEAS